MTSWKSVALISILLQLSAVSADPINFISEWGWGNSTWKLVFSCSIELTQSYTPDSVEDGFYIQLDMEGQSRDIASAHYPFSADSSYIVTSDVGANKRYQLYTMDNIWEPSGIKTYTFTLEFDNSDTTVYGNWPQGNCTGPFSTT